MEGVFEGEAFLDWLARVDKEAHGWVRVLPVDHVDEPDDDVEEELAEEDEGDDGVEPDAPGGWQEIGRVIDNRLSTPADPRYCITTAYASIYSIFGDPYMLCEVCYISYSERVPGKHFHQNTHETVAVLADNLEGHRCKCCKGKYYQVTRVEVCNICNPSL